MESLNASNARQNFYNLMSHVNISHKPIHISGKNGNVVMLSEEDWRAIEESLYLNSIPGLVDDIKNSEQESLESMINANDVEW